MTELLPELSVSRETIDRLQHFSDLVLRWTPTINLISSASASEIWQRHILDSAQLFPLAPPSFAHWADLGSGGGFPGIVVAILAQEASPNARFSLVESDQRKATFLRSASRELDLGVSVLSERIESLPPLAADVLSARALGSLSDLIGFAVRHLTVAGVALFPKGATVDDEIAQARRSWRFDLLKNRSITNEDAAILRVERMNRA